MRFAGLVTALTITLIVGIHPLFSQQVKRVLWTESSGCRTTGFSSEEALQMLSSCDSWVSDDATIQIIQINDLAVTVIMGDDGDYILADTYITNKSDLRILADPFQSVLFAWKTHDVSTRPERFNPMSGQEIASKLRRRAKWWNVLDGVLASFARSTTTITSNTSGDINVRGLGSGGSFTASGSYSGTTQTTISTPDLIAQMQSAARIRARTENAANAGAYYIESAMKANTVFPKQSVSGIIYFKRKKAPAAVFSIRIGDILFDFPSPKPTALGVRARAANVQPIPVPDGDFLNGTQISATARIDPPSLTETRADYSAVPSPGISRTAAGGIEMVWVPSGSFLMGASNRNKSEGKTRPVTISQGFWIGKFEVTQGQWLAEMGFNPTHFDKCGRDCPVENVSWDDAMKFLARLNAKNDGLVYSLPTEAEWEYAARSNAPTNEIDSRSWYRNNSGNSTKPVGKKRPNELGLYDTLGNVWEWCSDWYGESGSDVVAIDPKGPAKGSRRVLRGGAWNEPSSDIDAAARGKWNPSVRYKGYGFRVLARTRR